MKRSAVVVGLGAVAGFITGLCAAAGAGDPVWVSPRVVVQDFGPEQVTDVDGNVADTTVQVVTRAICPASIDAGDGRRVIVGQGELPQDIALPTPGDWDPHGRLIATDHGMLHGGGLTLVFNASGTVPEAAVEALQRIANRYGALFSDPITVVMSVNYQSLGGSTLGFASSVVNNFTWTNARNRWVLDMDADDTIHTFLPAGTIPVKYNGATVTNEGQVFLNRAVQKAIGLSTSGANTASIVINSNFGFDYDPSNGIGGALVDFESVITHEVGHALGFTSGVDNRASDIENIDIFRFATSDVVNTTALFQTTARTAGTGKQGVECFTEFLMNAAPIVGPVGPWRMSTGESGDGRQASHWRDNTLGGGYIGIMDPVDDGTNFVGYLGSSDQRTFDALGYDFVEDGSAQAPGVFTTTSPINNATGVSLTPSLIWTVSDGADEYRVQLDENASFSSPEVDEWVVGTSFDVPVSAGLEEATTYRWRVTARNDIGVRVLPSRSFTTLGGPPVPPGSFSLLTPASGSTGVTLTPTLTWAASGGASSYTVQVDDDANFTSPVVNEAGVTDLSFVVPSGALANSTLYRWRVIATNGNGNTNSLPAGNFTFTTGAFPPTAFSLSSPADAATGQSLTPSFTWTASTNVAFYQLVIDDNADFSSPVQSHIVVNTFFVLPVALNLSTNYHWKVTAFGTGGNTSSTPFSRSFTTLGTPPGAFSLSSPADAAVLTADNPLLEWTASSGASSYTVEVDDDPGFASPEVSASGVLATSYQVDPGILLDGGAYSWRITASNISGDTPSTPASRTFTINVPGGECPGDATGDGVVNFDDLNAVLQNWETAGPAGDVAPIGAPDGVVNFDDLNAVLQNWEANCN